MGVEVGVRGGVRGLVGGGGGLSSLCSTSLRRPLLSRDSAAAFRADFAHLARLAHSSTLFTVLSPPLLLLVSLRLVCLSPTRHRSSLCFPHVFYFSFSLSVIIIVIRITHRRPHSPFLL